MIIQKVEQYEDLEKVERNQKGFFAKDISNNSLKNNKAGKYENLYRKHGH